MPLLVWKEQFDCGCEGCSFVIPKPRTGESIGEYIVASRKYSMSTYVRNIARRHSAPAGAPILMLQSMPEQKQRGPRPTSPLGIFVPVGWCPLAKLYKLPPVT